MNNHKEHPERNKISQHEAKAPHAINEDLDRAADFVEGKVVEIAKEGSELKPSSQNSHGSIQEVTSKDSDATESDREKIKAKLLRNAGSKAKMQSEVNVVLHKSQKELDAKVKRLKRSRDFFGLSNAIAELREIIRTIEEVAKMSFEQLQSLWLKFVHGFA